MPSIDRETAIDLLDVQAARVAEMNNASGEAFDRRDAGRGLHHGYTWTTPHEGGCRGCEFEAMSGRPCPIHGAAHV